MIHDLGTPKERFAKRYRFQNGIFSLINTVIKFFYQSDCKVAQAIEPKKILICNLGHQGDVVISTVFLRHLRFLFPSSTFDYLGGPYSKSVFGSIKDINKVHYINHWYFSKGPIPGYGLFHYLIQLFKLQSEIKSCNYDIAIDLRAWFPNSIFLIWLSGIPVRIGWDRLGLGALLTHPHKFSYDRRHEIEYQLDLLKNFSEADTSSIPMEMIPLHIDLAAFKKVNFLLNSSGEYCVMHISGSTQSREWTIPGWIEVARHCLKHQITPVITGIGNRALELSHEIQKSVPEALILVNKLLWNEYAALISKAKFVISIETSAGHIAASLGRPTISIYGGMADWRHWKPFGKNIYTISLDIECSPCFKKLGCESMACLRSLRSNTVISSIDCILDELK
jgi:heptosyltransferase-2